MLAELKRLEGISFLYWSSVRPQVEMNQSVEDAIGHGLTFLILGRSDYHKQFRHLS